MSAAGGVLGGGGSGGGGGSRSWSLCAPSTRLIRILEGVAIRVPKDLPLLAPPSQKALRVAQHGSAGCPSVVRWWRAL